MVTGASGFLGREVMRRMAGDYERIGVALQHASGELLRRDVRRPGTVFELVEELQPDVVVHCAAYRDPDFCEQHPAETRRLNVDPVRALCESLPQQARLVLISTDYVFDGEHPPYDEDALRVPVNVYGESKLEAEDIVRGRPGSLIVRIPVLIGAGDDLASSGFIAQLVEAAQSASELELDDVLVRFPTWTRDVAGAIAFLLARGAEGIFHVSGPRGGTRFAWTVETARLLGRPAEHLRPSRTVVERVARRPRDSELAADKIRAMGYTALTDFAVAAREILESLGVSGPSRERPGSPA